jgi:hypothetical protein
MTATTGKWLLILFSLSVNASMWNPVSGRVNCLICVISYIKTADTGVLYSPVSDQKYAVATFKRAFGEYLIARNDSMYEMTIQMIKDEMHTAYSLNNDTRYFLIVVERINPPPHAVAGIYKDGNLSFLDPQTPQGSGYRITEVDIYEVHPEKLSDSFLRSINVRKTCRK